MGKRGRELAIKIYSRDRIKKQYADLIINLLNKNDKEY